MAMRKFTVIGVFNERASAEKAIESLYNAGFPSENIRYSGDATTGGFVDNIKNLFTGHGTHSDAVLHDLTEMGLPQEQARYYAQEHHAGRTIVTVLADEREQEARTIMRNQGGYDHSRPSGTTADNRDMRGSETRQPGYNPQAGTIPTTGQTNTTGASQSPAPPRMPDRAQPTANANMPNTGTPKTPDISQPFAGAKAPDMPTAKKTDMPGSGFKAPDIAAPKTPDMSRPKTPDIAAPRTPDMGSPKSPDMSRPKAADISQPSSGQKMPDTTRPFANTGTPDVRSPKIPDVSQSPASARMPDTTTPKASDASNTRIPDISQPSSNFKTPDVSSPKFSDASAPRTPDTVRPSANTGTPDIRSPKIPDMSMPKTPDLSIPKAGSAPQPGARITDANTQKAPNMPPTAPGTRTPDMTSPRMPDMSPPAPGARVADSRNTETTRPDAGSTGLRGTTPATTGSGNVTPGYEQSVVQRPGTESGQRPATSAQPGETMRVPIRGERVEGDKKIDTQNEVAAGQSTMAENQRINDRDTRYQTSPTNMRKKVRDNDDIDEGELPIDSI